MGHYECSCIESGLVLRDETRLILIAESADQFLPIALPMKGCYDRGGGIDLPDRLDGHARQLEAFVSTLAYEADYYRQGKRQKTAKPTKRTLEDALDELRADGWGGKLGDRRISFSLVDHRAFAAIVALVAKNGAHAWKRFAKVGLASKPPSREKPLLAAIVAAPESKGPRVVYVDALLERDDARGKLLAALPALDKLSFEELFALAFPVPEISSTIYDTKFVAKRKASLRPALVELVRFLAWGTTLAPSGDVGQFYGFSFKRYDDGAAEPYCKRARKQYAGFPSLLAAVDANEREWRESDAEDDEDDEDDDEE